MAEKILHKFTCEFLCKKQKKRIARERCLFLCGEWVFTHEKVLQKTHKRKARPAIFCPKGGAVHTADVPDEALPVLLPHEEPYFSEKECEALCTHDRSPPT